MRCARCPRAADRGVYRHRFTAPAAWQGTVSHLISVALTLTVVTYNIGVSADQMFAGSGGMGFRQKLFDDVCLLMKVMAF